MSAVSPSSARDGEGCYTAWVPLQAVTSRDSGGWPLGLAHDMKHVQPMCQGRA